ncbi:MAG: hypothetical protein QXO69_02140 [archaeon]
MNAELRVKDLEEARGKLRSANAKLERRLIVRDCYFDKSRYIKNEIIRLRNLSILFPAKSTKASLSYEQAPETYSTSVSDFDAAYGILEKIAGRPFVDIIWFGETYSLKGAKIELRSIRDGFSYVVAYGNDESVISALKELSLNATLMEKGAVNALIKP